MESIPLAGLLYVRALRAEGVCSHLGMAMGMCVGMRMGWVWVGYVYGVGMGWVWVRYGHMRMRMASGSQ